MIETRAYLTAAKDAGMTDEELTAVVDIIAANPEAGDMMPGYGGARKLGHPGVLAQRVRKGREGEPDAG